MGNLTWKNTEDIIIDEIINKTDFYNFLKEKIIWKKNDTFSILTTKWNFLNQNDKNNIYGFSEKKLKMLIDWWRSNKFRDDIIFLESSKNNNWINTYTFDVESSSDILESKNTLSIIIKKMFDRFFILNLKEIKKFLTSFENSSNSMKLFIEKLLKILDEKYTEESIIYFSSIYQIFEKSIFDKESNWIEKELIYLVWIHWIIKKLIVIQKTFFNFKKINFERYLILTPKYDTSINNFSLKNWYIYIIDLTWIIDTIFYKNKQINYYYDINWFSKDINSKFITLKIKNLFNWKDENNFFIETYIKKFNISNLKFYIEKDTTSLNSMKLNELSTTILWI